MSATAPDTRLGPVPIETPTGDEGQLLVGRQRNGPHIQLMALVEGSARRSTR
jgi:hypothetical protein